MSLKTTQGAAFVHALKLQLNLLREHANQATAIYNGGLQSAKILLTYQDRNGHNAIANLDFCNAESVPPEFKKFLADYATRLIGESWILENQLLEAQEGKK